MTTQHRCCEKGLFTEYKEPSIKVTFYSVLNNKRVSRSKVSVLSYFEVHVSPVSVTGVVAREDPNADNCSTEICHEDGSVII